MAYTPSANITHNNSSDSFVYIARLGSSLIEVPYQEGMTVADAFEKAGLDVPDTVSIRGERFPATAILEEGDRMTLTQSVKGA